MSTIRILPDILSNKIAAGEIVNRPGSVVKELLENALDAESTKVLVEVEKGGKSLIRVSDNGTGMNHDDALLCVERFATSKIQKDNDLFSIKTFGFRGEALPSIAAVSRFNLITRDDASETAISIRIDGGKMVKVAETGAPRGTMVSVSQIFFNTPARRKFLKSINTEMGHIADVVSSMAMAHFQIQFRMVHNAKIVKQWLPVSDPFDRIAEVMGKNLKSDLYPVSFFKDGIKISGAIGSPRIYRSTSRSMYLYVNGRFIRDRLIQHAIFKGYHQRLMKGQFPVAVIFLEIPPDQVDVNVHPTKNEVRFSEQRIIYDIVSNVIKESLRLRERPFSSSGKQTSSEKFPSFSISETPRTFYRPAVNVSEECDLVTDISTTTESAAILSENVREPGILQNKTPTVSDIYKTKPEFPVQQTIWEERQLESMKVIGQCHDSYIIIESPDGLILVDQHAAHERIVYERLKNRSTDLISKAQQLLVPETFDLGFSDAAVLEKIIPHFEQIGLLIEPFGGNTFIVKTVPQMLEGQEMQPIIREFIEKIQEVGVLPDINGAFDECLKLMACHGAIRAHHALSEKQIQELLIQLDACENPSNCPHGRPTCIRWSLKFIEKSFHRIL
jgi:DNA mismatch repair protein MutL